MKSLLVFLMMGMGLSAKAGMVYVPVAMKPETAKLVVVLHGCLQSAEAMALGTGWNQLADAGNIVVLYLQVPAGSNPLNCWSWFLPENQRPDSGQLRGIHEEVNSLKESLRLKNPDTFVVGLSSGAVTAAGLLACFPDDFTAGALHSGASYGLARTLEEAEKVLKEGPSTATSRGPCRPERFTGSLMVVHGSLDTVVHPQNAWRLIADFVTKNPPSSQQEMKDLDHPATVFDFDSEKGTRGRVVMIMGLGHAWSGFSKNLRLGHLLGPGAKFPTRLPFFSDTGPNATQLMWDFFKEISAKKEP
ncbi:MAG: PHB depolymerase family esterase [Bdellovibrionaceae bacterium]|nr:PHB depolymerase family esterase [Pseudobdellovibrionaceae bacterium]MBX3034779.1 PHB depolymerase family esterase [Pseudobdellovibrionaceae bacterium]